MFSFVKTELATMILTNQQIYNLCETIILRKNIFQMLDFLGYSCMGLLLCDLASTTTIKTMFKL